MPSLKATFLLSCPVCGRSMRVPVQLLGRTAACGHCHGTFVVSENDNYIENELTKSVPVNGPSILQQTADALEMSHLIVTRVP